MSCWLPSPVQLMTKSYWPTNWQCTVLLLLLQQLLLLVIVVVVVVVVVVMLLSDKLTVTPSLIHSTYNNMHDRLKCGWTAINITKISQWVSSTGWAKKTQTCLSVDNSAMITHRKACCMSEVLECWRQKGPNLHKKSFKYSLPNLPKSSLSLKLGICLHSHVPEFIELKNSLPKSPDLNFVNYSVWRHCKR